MILNYVLLFIVGFIAGAIAVALYVRRSMDRLQADLFDKTLITKLIKEQLPKRSNNALTREIKNRKGK